MLIPKSLTRHTPVTVTVTLPRKWMAEYFLDWVAEAFSEAILGNEGQHLNATITEKAVVFERVSSAIDAAEGGERSESVTTR